MDREVLIRNPETGDIERKSVAYSGSIPRTVWRNLNRRLLKLDYGGYFYPCDAMDAYQEAVRQVSEGVARLKRGEITLKKATPETYLTAIAYRALCRYHLREVAPRRAAYRAVEETTVARGAVGEDRFDIDNYNGTEDSPDKSLTDIFDEPCEETLPVGSALTAQQLVETLPGLPSMRERRETALNLLGEICENLLKRNRAYRIIIDAFAAYIVAECNLRQAAALCRVPLRTFYARWPKFLKLAKGAAR